MGWHPPCDQAAHAIVKNAWEGVTVHGGEAEVGLSGGHVSHCAGRVHGVRGPASSWLWFPADRSPSNSCFLPPGPEYCPTVPLMILWLGGPLEMQGKPVQSLV